MIEKLKNKNLEIFGGRPKKVLILIFFITIAVRILAIFILRWHIKPDLWEYHDIALNILNGKGYFHPFLKTKYYFYISPFYCYWSAFVYFLTNKNYLIIELLQVFISGVSVLFLMGIAKKIFNDKVAGLCGLVYALHPGFIIYTIKLHEFIFVQFLMLALIYLILMRRNIFLIGILIGLGFYVRSVFIFFIPPFFVYTLWKYRLRESFNKAIILITITLIAMVPWVYRGYKIYGRFILQTHAGKAFWQGNCPFTSGSSLTKDNRDILLVAPEEFRNKVFSLNEIEQNDFFRNEAIRYIKANPSRFIKNTIRKFYYFWWFSPQAGLWYPFSWLIIYKVFYSLMALFFIYGAYCIFKHRRTIDLAAVIFMFSFVFLVSALHSFVYVEIRHRWMIEPIIIIISAYGIFKLYQKINNKSELVFQNK